MNSFPNENICPMFTIATKEEQKCAIAVMGGKK